MSLNLNNKNNNETDQLTSQKISFIEFIIILFILIIFGYLIFSFISQIYLMNLELKHLVSLVQSLQDNQIDLKSQLLIKDQQIKLLESTLKDLNSSSSSTITTLNDTQNFELLKKEVIKNNNEMTKLCFTTTGIVLGVILVLKFIKLF